MMRTESVIFAAMLLAVVLSGVVCYQIGRAEGLDDARVVASYCIAKINSVVTLARGPLKIVPPIVSPSQWRTGGEDGR